MPIDPTLHNSVGDALSVILAARQQEAQREHAMAVIAEQDRLRAAAEQNRRDYEQEVRQAALDLEEQRAMGALSVIRDQWGDAPIPGGGLADGFGLMSDADRYAPTEAEVDEMVAAVSSGDPKKLYGYDPSLAPGMLTAIKPLYEQHLITEREIDKEDRLEAKEGEDARAMLMALGLDPTSIPKDPAQAKALLTVEQKQSELDHRLDVERQVHEQKSEFDKALAEERALAFLSRNASTYKELFKVDVPTDLTGANAVAEAKKLEFAIADERELNVERRVLEQKSEFDKALAEEQALAFLSRNASTYKELFKTSVPEGLKGANAVAEAKKLEFAIADARELNLAKKKADQDRAQKLKDKVSALRQSGRAVTRFDPDNEESVDIAFGTVARMERDRKLSGERAYGQEIGARVAALEAQAKTLLRTGGEESAKAAASLQEQANKLRTEVGENPGDRMAGMQEGIAMAAADKWILVHQGADNERDRQFARAQLENIDKTHLPEKYIEDKLGSGGGTSGVQDKRTGELLDKKVKGYQAQLKKVNKRVRPGQEKATLEWIEGNMNFFQEANPADVIRLVEPLREDLKNIIADVEGFIEAYEGGMTKADAFALYPNSQAAVSSYFPGIGEKASALRVPLNPLTITKHYQKSLNHIREIIRLASYRAAVSPEPQ